MLLWPLCDSETQQLPGMQKQWGLPMELTEHSLSFPARKWDSWRQPQPWAQAAPWGQGCAEARPGCHPEHWAQLSRAGTQLEAGTPAGLVLGSLGSGWAQMGLLGHRSGGKSCSHSSPKQKQNCYVIPEKSVRSSEENTHEGDNVWGKVLS